MVLDDKWSSWTNAKNAAKCPKRGENGHDAQKCRRESVIICFNCRAPGHKSTACPEPRNNSKRKCGGCGKKGHSAANCPTRETWKCKNCAGNGHAHWECTNPRDYFKLRCHLCNEHGHSQQ
ncbi:hypothetical protein CERSUDRAFT_118261, partial [Gelatoporia subvermispora B]